MRNRRRFVPIVATIPLTAFFGLHSFTSVADNPRFETYHTLDVIRLMTSGAALAVTLVGIVVLLVMYFRGSPSEDKKAEEQQKQE